MISYKAERLKEPFVSRMTKEHYAEDGRGLTYEDYWIFVCIIGHQHYRNYCTAHWRDSDIMDKTDVWKALKEVSYEN